MRPPQSQERFVHLDILRGFALFGMFMVHLTGYADGKGPVHDAIISSIGYVFRTKFFALFAFMFGVSFAVQLMRAESRGDGFVGIYLRRLLSLAVIALAIQVVFNYTVLLEYACLGVILVLVRRLSNRWILLLFATCVLWGPGYYFVDGGRILLREGSVRAAEASILNEKVAAKAHSDSVMAERKAAPVEPQVTPSYPQAMEERMHDAWDSVSSLPFWYPNIAPLGLFLLGLLAVRSGMVARPNEHRRTIKKFMVLGAVLFTWAVMKRHVSLRFIDVGYSPWNGALQSLFYLPQPLYLMFTYAGAVVLWGTGILAPLAWAGRMAVSNYIVQLIFLEFVLGTDYGLDVSLPTVIIPLVAVTFFAAQVVASRWWLSRYRYGPVEWVWRSATYARLQPMRMAEPSRGL